MGVVVEFNDRRRDVHEQGKWTTWKSVQPGDRVVAARGLFQNEREARTSENPPLTVVSAGHELVDEMQYIKDENDKFVQKPTGKKRKVLMYRATDPSGAEHVWERPGARKILHLPKQ